MNPNKVYAIFLLDESGSMSAMRDEAIQLFNTQLEQIRSQDVDTRVALLTFSTQVETKTWDEDPDKVDYLNEGNYIPDGNTAMYDAIGSAIDKLQLQDDWKDENVKALFIVVTDGAENASRNYSRDALQARIKKMNDSDRATFTILGTNLNLHDLSETLAIPVSNMANFQGGSRGLQAASAQLSHSTQGFYGNVLRGGAGLNANFYNSKNDVLNIDPDDISQKDVWTANSD